MDQLILLAILISLGYFFGRRAEKNHYKSINERERLFLRLHHTGAADEDAEQHS